MLSGASVLYGAWLSLAVVPFSAASPFEPHPLPNRGPWFEGWFTRVTDHTANWSIAVICGSFQPKNSSSFSSSWVAALVTLPNGSMYTEQVFPDQASLVITDHDQPVQQPPKTGSPAVFEWRSSLGVLKVDNNRSSLDFKFPSGLALSISAEGRTPWQRDCPDSCGPEGWVGRLPDAALPTHYFVHSLASPAVYSVNGLRGQGFAHQETNYGARFPSAWVWVQGVSADGRHQLLVAGGSSKVAGITARPFVIGFRSPDRHWDFRGVDLDRISAKVNGCSGQLSITAESKAGDRRFVLEMVAPLASFSQPLYFPTKDGWSNTPGCEESYIAVANVKLFEGGNNLPVEQFELRNAALEFGGSYRCVTGVTNPESFTLNSLEAPEIIV